MFLMDIIEAVNALSAIQTATTEALTAGGGEAAAEMEVYAKANAPWTDRTGNARNTLEGFCIGEQDSISIGVCGNMPYSPHLELGFQGRYAILSPTVESYSPRLIDMVRSSVASASARSGGGVSVE